MLKLMRKHTKAIMAVVVLFFILSCFAGYGMYSRSDSGGGERDYAVAKIGGRKVMRSEVDSSMVRIAEQAGLSEISESDWLNLRQVALDSMAVQGELEKEIKNRKINITKDEVDAAYANLRDSYPTREFFAEELERMGIKEQDLKNNIKNQLQREKVMQELTMEINVPENEAKEYYEAVKSFIYKRDKGFMLNIASFRSREAAEKVQQAISAGTAWDTALEENKSELVTSNAYDNPGEMPEAAMQGSMEVLKNYPLNKVSPVMELAANEYAIVIKRSKTEERIVPFDEVSQDVVNTIKSQQVEKIFADLRNRANVVILDPSVFPGAEAPEPEPEPEQKEVSADAN